MAQPYVGEIRMFAGNFAPAGWMFCEGQLLPISENETLFQLIGTTYGGDGKSNFALPNLQGALRPAVRADRPSARLRPFEALPAAVQPVLRHDATLPLVSLTRRAARAQPARHQGRAHKSFGRRTVRAAQSGRCGSDRRQREQCGTHRHRPPRRRRGRAARTRHCSRTAPGSRALAFRPPEGPS